VARVFNPWLAEPIRASRSVRPLGRLQLFVIAIFLTCPYVCAEIAVSLPLEGHYRAGRYMPVRVRVAGEQGRISLSARGAIPTEIQSSGELDAIVPWLAVSESVTSLEARADSSGHQTVNSTLHVLDEDERLVAVVGEDADAAKRLFPGKRVIAVALDPSAPLLEPVQAWESLDAVVFSEAAAARLDDAHRAALLAAGTRLVVRSTSVPDQSSPWNRSGEFWILQYEPAGPRSALEPQAYGPTYGWLRGWPATFRAQVFLFATLYCILAIGLVLWRPRFVVTGFLVFSAIAATLFTAWYSRRSTFLHLDMGVLIAADGRTQYDAWTWRSPVRASAGSFPMTVLTHPMLHSLRQIEATDLQLHVPSDRAPASFTYRLDVGQSLAFLNRSLMPEYYPPTLRPVSRESEEFADQLYVRPGDRIAGEASIAIPRSSGTTSTVVIDRR
jgi:hypothetical protein